MRSARDGPSPPLAETLGVTVEALAAGVLRIANADMATALKLVSIDKGHDPRDFTLVAFGGGGALHAVALGEALRFRKVVVPRNPAVFSAWGMLVADLRRDFVQTRISRLDDSTAARAVGGVLRARTRGAGGGEPGQSRTRTRLRPLRRPAVPGGRSTPSRSRSRTTSGAALARFHEAHERAYSFRLDRAVELVNLHVTVRGALGGAHHPRLPPGTSVEDARSGTRQVDFGEDGRRDAATYWRGKLPPGAEIHGPSIIEEDASTCLLPPGRLARVDEFGHLHLALTRGKAP